MSNNDLPLRDKIQRALQLDTAVRLVWRCAPRWTLINVVMVFVQGLLPLATLYIMKSVVDAVAVGFTAADKQAAVRIVLTWIVLAAVLAILAAACRALGEVASEAQAQVVTDEVSQLLHAQSLAVDLEYYEDPKYYDTLHRAQREAPYRPTRIVSGLVQIAQNGLSLLGIGLLLFAFNWVLGLLVFAATVPGAFLRVRYSRRRYGFEKSHTEKERLALHYHWMMTNPDHAKEIRLFGLGAVFQERFGKLREELRRGRLSLIQRRALTDVVAQVAATCAVFAALGFLTVEAVRGSVTLGSLVMYYQGFQSGMRFLQGVLQSLAGLYEDNLFLTNYHEFMDLTPRIRRSDSPRPIPEPIVRGIDFKDVSFTYPSSGKRVLQGVNLNLAPGQVIALVGANGSGKTTLVKLLCRLYDPEEGRIAVEDVDLREIDPLEWRRRLSVVFQDYVRYALSARDNIWFGNVALDPSHERVEQAARRAGANRVIESLPLGYETTLGFWFRKGQELSGGEWQKVALARAFMRDAQVVVLDEPTSSLDPLAEAEVFRHFRELVRGRSAILISHRFSTVQLADHIYVLDGGRILEHGSHRELVALGGLYSRLYRTQAQHYQ